MFSLDWTISIVFAVLGVNQETEKLYHREHRDNETTEKTLFVFFKKHNRTSRWSRSLGVLGDKAFLFVKQLK
jgi:hypothetical protein